MIRLREQKNLIREKNIKKLIHFLFWNEAALKAEMAEKTGISVVTINHLVKGLVEENHLIEGELVQQKLGRPAIEYHFNYEKHYYLLVSIQEENHCLGVISKIVDLRGREVYATWHDFDPITLETFKEIVSVGLRQDYPISKIGISIPGKVNGDTITSSWYDKFDDWHIKAELAQVSDIPVLIQNDAHVMTIGYCINHNIALEENIVGIYYPANSMPGITIFSNGQLVEGNFSLAGEAKYLPMLIDSPEPQTGQELAEKLSDIAALYNVIIAPNHFILSSDKVQQSVIEQQLKQNTYLERHPNKPSIHFDDNFQQSVTSGLRWLVSQQSMYEHILFNEERSYD